MAYWLVEQEHKHITKKFVKISVYGFNLFDVRTYILAKMQIITFNLNLLRAQASVDASNYTTFIHTH